MNDIDRNSAMAAVPMRGAIQDIQPLENGGVRVAVSVPTRPMQRKLLRLGPAIKREFELDAFGKQILEWCDGRNSITDLIRLFTETYRLHPHESEKALLSFVRTLVRKGILTLAVAKERSKKTR